MYSTEVELSFLEFFQLTGHNVFDMDIGTAYDITDLGYQIMSTNGSWNDIRKIIRKPDAPEFIIDTDWSSLKCSGEHKLLCKHIDTDIIECIRVDTIMPHDQLQLNELNIWKDFKVFQTNKFIQIVDLELSGNSIYLSNNIASHNTSFGDTDTTAGGKAIPFHSSVRIKLKRLGQIKGDINGMDTTVGIKTQAVVVKNRLGPPLRSVTYDIFFNSGIDDFGSWLSILKDMNFLKQAGAWYSYDIANEDTGELITKKFLSKDFKKLVLETPGLKEQIYAKICDGFIMKYNESGFETELTVEDDN